MNVLGPSLRDRVRKLKELTIGVLLIINLNYIVNFLYTKILLNNFLTYHAFKIQSV